MTSGRIPATREQRTRWNLSRRYGLTPADVAKMLADQGGVCAICGEVPKKLRVDHNHKTGKVRGILCHRCNLMIAGIEESEFYERAIAYLMQADMDSFGDMAQAIAIIPASPGVRK